MLTCRRMLTSIVLLLLLSGCEGGVLAPEDTDSQRCRCGSGPEREFPRCIDGRMPLCICDTLNGPPRASCN